MAKSEKIAYILEQVRLCLDRKDFVRAQVRTAPQAALQCRGCITGCIGGWLLHRTRSLRHSSKRR